LGTEAEIQNFREGKKMKKLLIILIISSVCFAIESPIGNPRVPQSSLQSGLRRSPNPINLNGNDIITGNVSGGKEFRGFVPYRSETDIGTSTAVDSFNTFLRQTAPVNLGSSQPYLPQPYYTPARTATSLIRRGGAPGLITYSPIRTTGGTGDFPTTLIQTKPAPIRKDSILNVPQYQYTLSRPLSYTNPADLEKIVKYSYKSQEDPKELQDILERIKSKETDREKKIETKTEEVEKAKEQTKEENLTSKIQQPQEPQKTTFERNEPQKIGQIPDVALKSKEKSLYELMLEQSEKTLRERKKQQIAKEANEPQEEQPEKDKSKSELAEIDKETAEALKGVHKTFATKSKTKFNQYMIAAEDYLQKGQYYRAADAYTLASIYNPSDPFAYAGRSHALFASGEYMSSAYYLMRAINMYPDYAAVRVDLNAMIPDKDKLESRISDVNKWIERTDSPELQFLLAYVYNQLGKPEQAKDAIDAASDKLPDNEAVKTLKDVIDNQ